jgi:hypothetical protein
MAAMVARQQLDDARRFAVGPDAQDDALIGPIHCRRLYQESIRTGQPHSPQRQGAAALSA